MEMRWHMVMIYATYCSVANKSKHAFLPPYPKLALASDEHVKDYVIDGVSKIVLDQIS